MSGWRLIVNWLLPPPLVLTTLLILPMPLIVKKGLLMFTKRFLFFELAGPIRLVHVALMITGVALAGSALHTYQMSLAPLPETLTPNQRTALLARRWREERNFWIATLTFLLWGLVFRFYQLMIEHLALKDRVRQLEQGAVAARTALGGAAGSGRQSAPAPTPKGAAAAKDLEPSAPPAPPEALASEPKKTK